MLMTFTRYCMQYVIKCFPGSPFRKFRNVLWNTVGFHVDGTANLLPTAILICGSITIGPETFIGDEVIITGGVIKIGARCDIAPRAIVHAGSHAMGTSLRRAGESYSGNILIGDGTWIGTGAIILDGAQIGGGSMVAAGSVVKAGVYPQNCLLAGIPAQIKKIF